MIRKLEEFLALKQGDQSVMQYVGKFNHLSQYATDQINSNSKIRTMMTGCLNVTYHEAVNMLFRQKKNIGSIRRLRRRRCRMGPLVATKSTRR
jgi:hypothetical protein